MVKGENIYKTYGNVEILKGINIEIKEKEVISIVGASGAGKTTLLQILGTLDEMSEPIGSLEIAGQDVSKLSAKKLAKFRNERIGFVFQFHQLLPEFTALENVCIPAFIKKTDKISAVKRAKELLDFLGLSERLNSKPGKLSGGETQRVAVARSLINDPSVVLADEPTGNLDSKSTSILYNLFLKLRDEFGKTFVVVTHDVPFSKLTDRKVIMKDGKIIRRESYHE